MSYQATKRHGGARLQCILLRERSQSDNYATFQKSKDQCVAGGLEGGRISEAEGILRAVKLFCVTLEHYMTRLSKPVELYNTKSKP